MNAQELKEILEHVPDDWNVVVEQREGEHYSTAGVRGDEQKRELIIEL